jgi:hypothetical protein
VVEAEGEGAGLFLFEFADGGFAASGGGFPVDVTGVVTFAVVTDAVEVDAASGAVSSDVALGDGGDAEEGGWGDDLGVDDEVGGWWEVAALAEHLEGEACGELDAFDVPASAARPCEAVLADLLFLCVYAEEVGGGALVGWDVGDLLDDLDGEAGDAALVVGEGDLDEGGLFCEDALGESSLDVEFLEDGLGEDAAEEDEGEHHAEEEVEEVVAGVDGAEADEEGHAGEVAALASELEASGWLYVSVEGAAEL